MSKKSCRYICDICNKSYSSANSLWNHTNKFHDTFIYNIKKHVENVENVEQNVENVEQNVENVEQNVENNKSIICEFCNKIFNTRSAKSKHKKKCTIILNKIEENDMTKIQEENKQKELELQIKKEEVLLKKEESKILQLKIKLQQSEKIDNITLRKLNKLLLQRNKRITNIQNNNQQINNNNIINNFQLIGFGKEDDIAEILTKQEKKMIMNAKFGSLEKLIEIVHCGKYSQFKNIIITNMKDNYMYKYDENHGMFVLSTKTDVLNTLIDHRVSDLEVIYHELLNKNKLDETTKNCIEKFINKIHNTELPFEDGEGKEYDNYRQYKISEIKILLFNNQDRITGDISLLLTTTN
jgi:hypothetical protein